MCCTQQMKILDTLQTTTGKTPVFSSITVRHSTYTRISSQIYTSTTISVVNPRVYLTNYSHKDISFPTLFEFRKYRNGKILNRIEYIRFTGIHYKKPKNEEILVSLM